MKKQITIYYLKKVKENFITLKAKLLILDFLLLSVYSYSQQGVSINTSGSIADISAMLDISGASKGLLINRMTTAERNLINNPAEGLLLINTDTKCLEIYFSPIWQSVYCACTPPITPTAETHTSSQTEIIWNWSSVFGANGYKYNTINDYASAIDNATNTNYTQTGLTCNTAYSLYVWAYDICGHSSELILNKSTNDCFNCGVDLLVDSRDGQNYQTVQIGSQCWMKKNLNYTTANSWCYDNNSSYCNTYGRLYTWDASTGGTSSSLNPSGVQGVCPSGWHVPSDDEWKQLEMYLGMLQVQADLTGWRGTDEGGKLKEIGTSHWTSPNTSATNFIGFTALPVGYRNMSGAFFDIGNYCSWWLATQDGSYAWRRILSYNGATVHRSTFDKGNGLAVRCLQD